MEINLQITDYEFTQMEQLLGRLLSDADEREQGLILHIHERLVNIREASVSNQTTLYRLKRLAEH